MRKRLLLWFACCAMAALQAEDLRVDLARCRLCFGTTIENARFGLDVNGKTLWAEAAEARWTGGTGRRLELRFPEPAVEWTLEFTSGEDGSVTITGSVRNAGRQAVRLGRCRLVDTTGPDSWLRVGVPAEEAVAFIASGWQIASRVVRLSDLNQPRKSKTLVQIYNRRPGKALHLGFVRYDRISTVHELGWDRIRGVPTLNTYCDFEGYDLPPGATVALERLRLTEGCDPYVELENWASLVQREYDIKIWPKTPAGWVGWSWVDGFEIERYEDVVLRNARAVRDRLPGLDIEYVWVSIGNLEDRQPGNWLRWNYELFPGGPQRLVHELGRLNFKLGFWCAPFWMSSKLASETEKFRDAFLLKEGKPLVVQHSLLGQMYVLDPTHPKTLGFLREVFDTYRKWGVRYFMIDFLNAVSGTTPGTHIPDGYYDRRLIPGPEAYRRGLQVIREAAGDETYLLGSTGPTLLNANLFPANRVGTDYGEGLPLSGSGKGFYPGTFVINRADYWTSHRAASEALAGNYFTHRKLYIADSGNVMTVDKPVPLADAQITATLFGINGSPVMLGDDIARMSQERLELIKQVFPRLPECARPLDLFEKPEPAWPEKFHLKVRREWDEWDLVAVFNYRTTPLEEEIAFKRLGLDPEAGYVVWDFWNERYLGVHRGALRTSVPAHSVRLIRIARARDYPWLLSTDMHVRQGQAEIVSVEWLPAAGRLLVEATRPQGYRGHVYLRAPKGWAVKNPLGLYLARDANEGCLIVRCDFDFSEGRRLRRAIEFVTIPTQ